MRLRCVELNASRRTLMSDNIQEKKSVDLIVTIN